VRFILAGEESRDAWNAFVTSHAGGHLYQSYEWGEVLSYSGAKIIRGGVENNGRWCATISMIVKQLGVRAATYLYAPLGPIVEFNDKEAVACLVQGVQRIAEDSNAICLRIDPNWPDDNGEVRNSLLQNGFIHLNKNWSSHNYPRLVMRVDLQGDEDELLKRVRKTHRQRITGTERNGVSVFSAETEPELRTFWHMLRRVGDVKGFLIRDYEYFAAMWAKFVRAGSGKLLLTKYKEDIIGGVLAIRYGRGCWYLYGASDQKYHHLNSNQRLHWEMMKWAKSMGCAVYDMGGTGTDYPILPESTNYSLYHFKKGFGAEVMYLTGYYDLIFRPAAYRCFRFGEEHVLPWGLAIVSSLQKLRQTLA